MLKEDGKTTLKTWDDVNALKIIAVTVTVADSPSRFVEKLTEQGERKEGIVTTVEDTPKSTSRRRGDLVLMENDPAEPE
jgi:hypothetical protein